MKVLAIFNVVLQTALLQALFFLIFHWIHQILDNICRELHCPPLLYIILCCIIATIFLYVDIRIVFLYFITSLRSVILT